MALSTGSAAEAETLRRWVRGGEKEGLGNAKETFEDAADPWHWKRDAGAKQCIMVVTGLRVTEMKMKS